MISEIITTLIGIPLSIITDFTSEKITSLVERNKYLADGLDELFITAFIEAVNRHKKHYDNTGVPILEQMVKKIKKDKTKFLKLFSGNDSLHNLTDAFYLTNLANQIAEEYIVDNKSLLYGIVLDCLHDYTRCFFAHVSGREFMSIALTDLFEIKDTVNESLNILKSININTSWADYVAFRDCVFDYYSKNNETYQATLAEYDAFIQLQYTELPLRGFTPHISGNAVAMNLEEIYVPLNIDVDSSPDNTEDSKVI